jgi:hypothetical protein
VTESVYVLADKPEMDASPQIAKAASNTGDTGRLICRASGAPKLRFTWSREGATIPVNTTEKYYIDFRQVCANSYTSRLGCSEEKLGNFEENLPPLCTFAVVQCVNMESKLIHPLKRIHC